MIIVIMFVATILTAVWLMLLMRATTEDWIAAAYSRALDNFCKIAKLHIKAGKKRERLSRCKGIASIGIRMLLVGDAEKEINKLEKENRRLQNGDLGSVSVFPIPGFVLQREFDAIGKGVIHKTIMEKCYELYGKKHATQKAKQLLAKLLSYPLIGVGTILIIAAILLGVESTTAGTAVLGVGTILILVLVYTIYDELSDQVKKRRRAIGKQFPGVVSKLALLVTSGMIMDRAWKETAYSQETEIYQEMRKTSEELDNLVSPEVAYSNFINRCNTKEVAKLASAIMQNQSKGNAEIGRLLKDMAHEAWQERRHTAKRDAEKANAKLMIPTMLLLLSILIMLMVPIAMNFTGI